MLVPSEQVVVLPFLLISHFEEVIVQLGEHVEICEGEVVAHEEGSAL